MLTVPFDEVLSQTTTNTMFKNQTILKNNEKYKYKHKTATGSKLYSYNSKQDYWTITLNRMQFQF